MLAGKGQQHQSHNHLYLKNVFFSVFSDFKLYQDPVMLFCIALKYIFANMVHLFLDLRQLLHLQLGSECAGDGASCRRQFWFALTFVLIFSLEDFFLLQGLRVLVYANVSEYLPTTEAIGFRITVHDKWTVPFVDAFGYNAPTGMLSSYGVRMVNAT